MDRRQFLRNIGILAAGTIAADQLELLDKLNWKRTLWPGANLAKTVEMDYADGLWTHGAFTARNIVIYNTKPGSKALTLIDLETGDGYQVNNHNQDIAEVGAKQGNFIVGFDKNGSLVINQSPIKRLL